MNEDLWLTIANVVLFLAILPGLLDPATAIPRWQSAATAGGLAIVTVANCLLLGARKSAVVVGLSTLLWYLLFIVRPA